MGKAKRTKSKKDVKQRKNVRKVEKNNFEIIERVWAEDGVVKVQTKKDGRISNMTVRDAAFRAAQINAMPVSKWHVKSKNDLITQIVEACREAKAQMESPKDSRAAAMNNLLEGLAPDGRSPEDMMKDHPLEVQEAWKLRQTFVHLSMEEMVAVLKERSLGKEAKMKLLAEEDYRKSLAKMELEQASAPGSSGE